MNEEKNTPVMEDIEESEQLQASPKPRKDRRRQLFVALVWARYLLPLATAIAVLILGCFKTVRFAFHKPISLFRLMWNTLISARAYRAGETTAARDWFYGMLAGVTIVDILLSLLAIFLVALAAVAACRAFVAGHKSEQSNRAKLAFKIAFPNRFCLYLSDLLLLVPALYPHLFSLISTRFLRIGNESAVYVVSNPALIVVGVSLVVTLALSIAIPRLERRLHMNMFLLHRTEEEE